MEFIQRFLKKYFNNKFLFSIAAALLFITGTLLYSLGELGVLDKVFLPKWSEFLTDVGKTILAGGIISFFLKFMKFLGVISEELTAVIYDSKYLENRKDLPEIWDRVTQVFFQNKFPAINALIREDIKLNYFPPETNHYYANTSEIFEIKMINPDLKVIQVKQISRLNLIPSILNGTYIFKSTNRIYTDESYKATSKLIYVTINGEKYDAKDFDPKEEDEDGKKQLISDFEVSLSDKKEKYTIEYELIKTYSLINNDKIVINVGHIHHNYKLRIDFSGIEIQFLEAGTTKKFKRNYENDHYIETEFKGLLYKSQGYLITLKG